MRKIKPKECQNVEFKSSWNDKYLEWICGFANAQGAAMYFGVNDEHEVVGLKNTKKLLEDIPNKIVNYLGYTPDTLLKQHASHPRNRNIANAFFKAGFIDAWGRGYKKIREGFEGAGLPMPTVENFCGGVRVTFQRKNVNIERPNPTDTQDVAGNVAGSALKDTLKSTLKGTQKHIVELIEENPDITIDNVAELLQMNRRGIVKHFKILKQKGIIRRVGPDKGGHWEIINNKE